MTEAGCSNHLCLLKQSVGGWVRRGPASCIAVLACCGQILSGVKLSRPHSG
jgi:hypothetical protein